MKMFFCAALIMAVLLSCRAFAEANPSVWAKGFTSEGAGETGLQLIGVVQTESGLEGIFTYFNIPEDKSRTGAIVIIGARSLTGEFWAGAVIQVKKTAESGWETIGKSPGKGEPEKLSVKTGADSGVTYIDFEDFRPFANSHKMGRVIISTGATAEFTLDVLTPPSR